MGKWVPEKTSHLDTFHAVSCCIYETKIPAPDLKWYTFSFCISSLLLDIFLYDTFLLKRDNAIFSDGAAQLTVNKTTQITLCIN